MIERIFPDDCAALRSRLQKSSPNILPSIMVITILLFVPHDPMVIKGVFFALLLICAGYVDAKTQNIPDELCALISLVSLIRSEPAQSLIGMFLVSVLLWIFGTIVRGSVGGGDIKLLAACGAVLGPCGIVLGTMFSLLFYLIFLLTRPLLHRQLEKKYAMAPWFGAGCSLAYLATMKG